MNLPNVIGCSVGLDESGLPCIRILTTKLDARTESEIRDRLGSVPIVVDEGPDVIAY